MSLRKWLLSDSCCHKINLLQGHKLRGKRFTKECRKLKKKFQVFGCPCPRAVTGPRGGVLILVRKGLQAEAVTTLRSEHNMWTAITYRVKGHTLGIVSAYLPPGEFHMNGTTIHEIGKLTAMLQIPWLIGGDFNSPPAELRELHAPLEGTRNTIHP